MTEPTLTDEELAEMEGLWEVAFADVGTSTLAYRSLATFPRLIAALRASREEAAREHDRAERLQARIWELQERAEFWATRKISR